MAQDPSASSRNTAATLAAAWRAALRLLRRYVDWLGRQGWRRLALLALLAVIVTALLSSLPPFDTRWGGSGRSSATHPPAAPAAPKPSRAEGSSVEIQIDERGVHVRAGDASPAASSPQPAASGASGASGVVIPVPPQVPAKVPEIDIPLPPGADREEVRRAVEEARDDIRSAIEDAKQAAAEAAHAALPGDEGFRLGDHLMSITMLLIVASLIAKVMGSGRKKAEVQAAVATERAEEESLKRQVVEARMAAMQAQVEPHFLFNTLASIDHLIETDPARASQMQKNLIALLRASMPTMREPNPSGLRPLKQELDVIRPYLEILKVRMEERLQVEIDVPEGLQSAEFPPMVIQSLVENAIKHGLEPKPEGGRLAVKAEIRHGKLRVSVSDTGLGFGKAATAGTGVGLVNIRERLQLLYGEKAALAVTENPAGGTLVAITVPYTHRGEAQEDR